MNEPLRATIRLTPDNESTWEKEEQKALHDLFQGAIELGLIDVPDRHPNAYKVKSYKVIIQRDDGGTSFLNLPTSEITLFISEEKFDYVNKITIS